MHIVELGNPYQTLSNNTMHTCTKYWHNFHTPQAVVPTLGNFHYDGRLKVCSQSRKSISDTLKVSIPAVDSICRSRTP